MNRMTRRRFLQAAGGATVATAAGTVGWKELADRTRTDPLPADQRVLVVLTMYGGNDGLNTVIPASDAAYQSARAELAYAEHEVLPLGEGLGLNPGLTGLKEQWDAGHLAIVRGVSYPKPDHSHFRSMDIWQSASPEHPLSTGWIGRWLDSVGHDPLQAISLEPVLPPLLVGAKTAGAALPLDGLRLPTGPLGTAFDAMGKASADDSPSQAAAAASISDLHRVNRQFGPSAPGISTAGSVPASRSPLTRQLEVAARCIETGAPSRVYSVSLGGFDTHADERATQQKLLTDLDAAVSGFLRRLSLTKRGRQVVLLAYSEFGRRVAANANQGTDHGTAGPVFVAGDSVRGGFFGAQPSLTDLDDGDLKPSTDFRDVYATLLQDVLNADPSSVISTRQRHLSLIN